MNFWVRTGCNWVTKNYTHVSASWKLCGKGSLTKVKTGQIIWDWYWGEKTNTVKGVESKKFQKL